AVLRLPRFHSQEERIWESTGSPSSAISAWTQRSEKPPRTLQCVAFDWQRANAERLPKGGRTTPNGITLFPSETRRSGAASSFVRAGRFMLKGVSEPARARMRRGNHATQPRS